MNKDKRSYNSNLTIMTKEFLVPSWPKILLYLLVGALVLMIWNGRQLWNQFNSSILVSPSSVATAQSQTSDWLEKTFNSVVNGRIAQIIFWAFAGCMVYVCIWFVVNIFSNIRNDIVADEYVHPKDYNRSGYWHSVIARKIF